MLPRCSANVCGMSQQLQCHDLSPTLLLSAQVYAFLQKSTLIHLLAKCKSIISKYLCILGLGVTFQDQTSINRRNPPH